MCFERIKTLSRSFSVRITAWIVALLTLTNVVDLVVSHRVVFNALRAHDEEELLAEVEEFTTEYRHNGVEGTIRKAGFELRANGELLLIVRLIGPDGRTIFSNQHDTDVERRLNGLSTQQLEEGQLVVVPRDSVGHDVEVVRTRLPDGNELQVVHTTEDRDAILGAVEQHLGMAILLILLLTGLSGMLLIQHALKPVRGLISVLESIRATGRFTARAPLRGSGDELDSLSGLFNSLLERISILLDTMRHSLDNVAHELRTPMTRFRSIAELALRENSSVTERDGLVSAVEESERILSSLDTLMDISEAEAGMMKLNIKRCSLASLIERVNTLYENLAEERNVAIVSRVPEELQVHVDTDRMTQVLANLLDNALKFTPPGGSVEFSAAEGPGTIEIFVKDSGAGIGSDDLPHIFERLYRGDKSRTSRGFGLGLSLVRAVVVAHSGSIRVTSEIDVGSQFQISLPITK